jgi:outer membrane protein OmpA-like peptidoglycan-associated protein
MGINSLFILVICFFCSLSNALSQQLIETKILDSISVIFKSGSAEIQNPQKLIDKFNLVKATTGKIRIISYTDTVGSQSANLKLGAKRLSTVSKLVRSTKLNSFVIDSLNKNELRSGRKLTDSAFRRVDIIIYSIENKFKFNEPINLNINFESSKDVLLPSSTENLKTLLSILQKDSTLRVQLNGHVCCQSAYELSVQRAERVKKYLISNGIKSTRIQCKGFSNTMPIVSATDFANIQKNMRVEVVFLK